MPTAGKEVVIIGGGITGLAAAYTLRQKSRDVGLPVRCTVVEKNGRWGGHILTDYVEGFVIEAGPDSILARKPSAIELCRELGIDGDLVPTDPAHQGAYIRHRQRLEPLPEGLSFLMPSKLGPFLRSGLLSPWGKIRMGLELFIPPSRAQMDESLAGFVERRLGRQALERVAEPLLAGIHAGDARQLSLLASFPQFREMESQYGSLVKAMWARRRAARQNGGAVRRSDVVHGPTAGSAAPGGLKLPAGPSAPGGPARPALSTFVSLKNGLSQLVQALIKASPDVEFLAGTGVRTIQRRLDQAWDWSTGYEVLLEDGRRLQADAVLLAAPASTVSGLLQQIQPIASRLLAQVPFVSVASVVLAFRSESVPNLPKGTGYVIPRTEGAPMTAVTWVTSKWPHTTPPGYQLFRFHFGRSGFETPVAWADEQLIAAARAELRSTLGLEPEPVLSKVYRWEKAMPQYLVGHLERMDQIDQALKETPGVFMAGAAYRGTGIPDCIRQGTEAAGALLDYLCPKVP